jgi:hypothetical protein
VWLHVYDEGVLLGVALQRERGDLRARTHVGSRCSFEDVVYVFDAAVLG